MANDEGLRKYADAVGFGPDFQFSHEDNTVGTKEESTKFETGAVRSADVQHLSFTSLPLIGLIGVARTAAEGEVKYGRYNYMLGMPLHDALEHTLNHWIMYILGDRSQPHLEHGAWGALYCVQAAVLHPELSAGRMLGPGATVTPEMKEYLESIREELATKREAGEFDGIGEWKLTDLPEIKRLLEQRNNHEFITGKK